MSADSIVSAQKDLTKNRRTRTGCLTCRARKIKCDERPGRCDNCERIMAQCDWPTLRTVQPSSDSGSGSIGPVRSKSKSKSTTRRASSTISSTPAQSQAQLPLVSPVLASASATAATGGTSRSRSRACVACRIARCKCSSELPSCSGCLANDIECKYTDTPSLPITGHVPAISIDVTPSSDGNHANQSPDMVVDVVLVEKTGREKAKMSKGTRPADDSGPETDTKRIIDRISRPVIDQHVEAFYKFFYHSQSNAFIHRGTLLRDIQTSQISPMLLLALCAVSARFVPSTTLLQGGSWAKESKTLLILSEEISLDMVATALLLAKYEINNGKYEGAWVLTSIAHRSALALGLHREVSGDDDENQRTTGNKASSNGQREVVGWVTRETRRRLFWACYCLDRMMSTGQPDYILTQQSSIHIRLPCEDHNYQLGIPCITPMLAPESSISQLLGHESSLSPPFGDSPIGLFGHYVQMTGMRYRVLVCTRTQDHTVDPPWSPTSTWAQCALDLQTWRATLTAPFQLTTDTVYARQAQGQLTSLIMLHIWYDQCLSDLYRVALPGFPESLSQDLLASAPAGWVNETRQACVRHAKNISNVLDTIQKHVDNDAFVFLDPSLPICVYESMRVQVQALFLAQEQEPDLEQRGQGSENPSGDSQQRARADVLQQDFDGMMGWVEKMCRYFRQANYLLREMRKLLQRHGLRARSGTESSMYDTSGAATPHHPWKRRVQQLQASDVQHERDHHGSNPNLMVTALASASGQSTNHLNALSSTAFSNQNHPNSIAMGPQTQHALVSNMNPNQHMINYDFGLTSDPNANAHTGTGLDNGSLSLSLSGTHENEQDAIHALLGGFDEQNVFGMGMGLDLSTGPDMGMSLGTGAGGIGGGPNDLGLGAGVGMGNWFGGFGGWMAAGYDPFGDNST